MKSLLFITLLTLSQIPKNDPNGIWEASTGSRFQLRLMGSDLHVQIIPGSNPTFLEYSLELKNAGGDPNIYSGSGHFRARLENGRECELDNEWEIVVVAPDRIIGVSSTVTPDPDTCEIVETGRIELNLERVQ